VTGACHPERKVHRVEFDTAVVASQLRQEPVPLALDPNSVWGAMRAIYESAVYSPINEIEGDNDDRV
jgi:hypothetical protein